MSAVSDRFMAALHHLDEHGDTGPMVELTAPGAVLRKLDRHQEETGPDGARVFWDDYRSVFGTITTEFTSTLDGETGSSLEWVSRSTLTDGAELTYSGVTVIDVVGDQVTGVRTYYDSAAFIRPTRA
ncbi:nuclear transport factor 2 family protein [Modestobacter muralis]|uniref:Nuclear transport factor 2 family protein n=1 Tax=Modestobacter muralis TaxID=1608614 RepID=A0A6P0EZV5_9ACTN|nr:nuclear transport factor 2 family protein [Modestobacter muralis]NEK95374.1 nuclear transport factor 2 family protein [Modestobacter muralis]NEN52262.1 nuclear transport factor 2 family protein [Modestobacter muralis]